MTAPAAEPLAIDVAALLERLPIGMAVLDAGPDFRCLRHNAAFLEMLGAPWRERGAAGAPLEELLGPPAARDTRGACERAVSTRQPCSLDEMTLEPGFGQNPRTYQWFVTPLLDSAGAVSALLSTSIELTRWKKIEAKLYDQQRQMLLALEAARMGVWAWNIGTGEITWSPNLETLHGFAPGEFGGTYPEFAALIHADDAPGVSQALERALADGTPYNTEFRIVWPDGSVHWMAGRGQAFYDEAGAPTHMIGLGIDITERKQAEEERARLYAEQQRASAAAEAAQARLAFLAEASATLAASLDYETTLAQVVRLAVDHMADWCSVYLLDAPGEGRWVAKLARDPAKQAVLDELHRSYPPERLPTTIVSRVLADGRPGLLPSMNYGMLAARAVDERHLGLYEALGLSSYMVVPLALHRQLCGLLVLARSEPSGAYGEDDLALAEELARRAVVAIEHARLYQAEQRARAEAEAAVRARDVFFSVAAHELKTPLTSLLGHAQLLQRRAAREGHLTPRDAHTVETLVAQARRLDTLVLAMLDIARIEHGQLRLERAPLDLAQLLRRVVAEAQPTYDRHTLALDALVSAPVHADALRLEQVFQNLIGNAVKYSPLGGTVWLSVEQCAGEVRVSIRDEGVGIPPAELPKLFQRFYRAENPDTREIGGMGIGLYVVREIVALHGGSVAVESELRRGSTFTVRLPLHSAEG